MTCPECNGQKRLFVLHSLNKGDNTEPGHYEICPVCRGEDTSKEETTLDPTCELCGAVLAQMDGSDQLYCPAGCRGG